MDKNTIVGFVLIFVLIMIYGQLMQPTAEDLEAAQRQQDSLAQVEQQLAASADLAPSPEAAPDSTEVPPLSDSLQQLQLQGTFGHFAASASGTEKEEVLENEMIRVTFSNKGGKIKEVLLKHYFKILTDEEKVESQGELKLMEDEKNRFEYLFPVANLAQGFVSSSDLYYQTKLDGNSIRFRASAGPGKYFEQTYTLTADSSYQIDYNIKMVGLQDVLNRQEDRLQLNWVTYADKLEKNTTYERNYTSVYFKAVDETPSYCACTSDGDEDAEGQALKWVAHSNQFFNTALVAEEAFNSGKMETRLIDIEEEDLKFMRSELNLPLRHQANESFNMKFYVGPNEYYRLAAAGDQLEDIIPYGRSIFGTINRWIIRPVFNFLAQFIGNMGIVILILTLVVKLVLYPLTYRMLYSQSKMSALKPRLAKLKDKHGDDQQAVQVETMKLYREFGVSPLGGCFPIFLQMPIWFALYRFFPASIEFRQASFLWATDLSSYDIAFNLPFNVPFYGEHVSLFTLLWALSTVAYTYYNTRHMDMTMNPMMKNMQYFMPLMFLFFFNNFAAGLTCYLLFSNLLNIIQTVVTKDYLIDKKKIEEELEAYRKKPKKKGGGFGERLEAALKEQQKQMQQKEQSKSKKKKK